METKIDIINNLKNATAKVDESINAIQPLINDNDPLSIHCLTEDLNELLRITEYLKSSVNSKKQKSLNERKLNESDLDGEFRLLLNSYNLLIKKCELLIIILEEGIKIKNQLSDITDNQILNYNNNVIKDLKHLGLDLVNIKRALRNEDTENEDTENEFSIPTLEELIRRTTLSSKKYNILEESILLNVKNKKYKIEGNKKKLLESISKLNKKIMIVNSNCNNFIEVKINKRNSEFRRYLIKIVECKSILEEGFNVDKSKLTNSIEELELQKKEVENSNKVIIDIKQEVLNILDDNIYSKDSNKEHYKHTIYLCKKIEEEHLSYVSILDKVIDLKKKGF